MADPDTAVEHASGGLASLTHEERRRRGERTRGVRNRVRATVPLVHRAERLPGEAALSSVVAMGARMRANQLDRALAAGADPAAGALLARRASQLTTRRIRAGLARALEAHLAEARRPRKRSSAAVPVRRREVLYAAPEIRRLVVCLLDDRVIRAQGTARVRGLLTDGMSPLYAHSPAGTLAHAVAAAIDSLHDEH
jgi:hypothetical protein